jgi:CHAD domain-containing protein
VNRHRRKSARGKRKRLKRETRSPRAPRLAAILIASIEQRWKKYLKELRRCKRSFSEESVHDLRVATRRLISTLLIVEIICPDPRVRVLERRLKKLFDALSPLRDTQVQMLTLEKKITQYPELETLLTILKVRERTLMAKIAVKVMKIDTTLLSRTVSAIKVVVGEHFARPMMQKIGMNAVIGAAAGKFMTAASFRDDIVATQPRTIHRARIAFKKLRYTLEALLPMLPALNKRQLKAMDAYQTRMGNIQDVEVLSAMIHNFAARRTLASRRKLSAFRRELAQQKKALIAEYVQSADELYKFWKLQKL